MDDKNAGSYSVDKPARLFSLDSDNLKVLKTEKTQTINLSQLEKSLLEKKDFFLSPLNRSGASVRSMDQRITEAIKPVMENMEVLNPHNFNALLTETHAALVKEVGQIETPEVKDSLITLIKLLKENADLVNLFQRYSSWLQKA